MDRSILPNDLWKIHSVEHGAKTVLNGNVDFLIGRIVGNRERRLFPGRKSFLSEHSRTPIYIIPVTIA
jgi:hypothetical protein